MISVLIAKVGSVRPMQIAGYALQVIRRSAICGQLELVDMSGVYLIGSGRLKVELV